MTPIASGVFADRAASRSRFSAPAPPRSAGRRQLGAQPVDRAGEGGARRPGDGDRFDHLDASGADLGRQRGRDSAVRPQRCLDGTGLPRGRDHLKRARSAGAEGGRHLPVADSGVIAAGHDLDRGHAGSQVEDRQGEQDEGDQGQAAEDERPAPEQLAPAGEAGRAVLTAVRPGQGEPVDLRAELCQHGGEQCQRRRQHEEDGDDDPECHRAKGGAGDEHHGGE